MSDINMTYSTEECKQINGLDFRYRKYFNVDEDLEFNSEYNSLVRYEGNFTDDEVDELNEQEYQQLKADIDLAFESEEYI